MRLALRFDMRAPDIGAPATDLYPASVEMCAFADAHGFETAYLAEHHGADDGYCPAPIVQASAILARTTRMRVHFSALVAVLHHPLRIAEDLAVLDVLRCSNRARRCSSAARPRRRRSAPPATATTICPPTPACSPCSTRSAAASGG